MISSNNDARNKKQKRAALVDGDSLLSSSLLSPVHVVLLSLGNVLQHFPDLLIQILPYIADRTVFNAIAFSNRDIYRKSKAILSPWPIRYNFKFGSSAPLMTWSPCGTRIACRFNSSNIVIHDQQRGPYRVNRNNYRNNYRNRDHINDLKFSPDGSFLVASCHVGIVKLWNNGTGNYELLQEWNIKEEVTGRWGHREICFIDVSPCSKYIIVALSSGNRIMLKSVDNGRTIKSMTPQPIMNCITKIKSSVDDHAVFICGKKDSANDEVVMLWRPYLDDANEDIGSFITLWRYHKFHINEFVLSCDNTMIAMYDTHRNEGRLLSIDKSTDYITQCQSFTSPRNVVELRSLFGFTPDNKFILCSTFNGLKYWSVAENICTEREHSLYTENGTKNLIVVNVSPNNRQLIVYDTQASAMTVISYLNRR